MCFCEPACGPDQELVVLNFDSIPVNDYGSIFNTYFGFDWTSFGAINADNADGYDPSGYVNGRQSPANVGYNAFGGDASFRLTSGNTFVALSAYITSAWQIDHTYVIEGFLNDSPVWEVSQTTDINTTILESFPDDEIDQIRISAFGGTTAPTVMFGGNHLAIDDIRVCVPAGEVEDGQVEEFAPEDLAFDAEAVEDDLSDGSGSAQAVSEQPDADEVDFNDTPSVVPVVAESVDDEAGVDIDAVEEEAEEAVEILEEDQEDQEDQDQEDQDQDQDQEDQEEQEEEEDQEDQEDQDQEDQEDQDQEDQEEQDQEIEE